jgi:hypothetical protein
MARKPASRAPRAPDPAKAALARIAELISRGGDPARVAREADSIISGWAGTLPDDEMRERLEDLRDQLASGVEAAREQADDVEQDDKAGAAAAGRALAALTAARDAFGHAAQSVGR